MAKISYNNLISKIRDLSLSDQLRLLEEMVALIRQKTGSSQSRSILELQGMGKDIWRNIDARKYIDEERASWNG